jgi:hypothetical protein
MIIHVKNEYLREYQAMYKQVQESGTSINYQKNSAIPRIPLVFCIMCSGQVKLATV